MPVVKRFIGGLFPAPQFSKPFFCSVLIDRNYGVWLSGSAHFYIREAIYEKSERGNGMRGGKPVGSWVIVVLP